MVDLDSGLAAAGCELWDRDERKDVPESLSSVVISIGIVPGSCSPEERGSGHTLG